MSFFKEWATSFWLIAKMPTIMFSALAAGYWGSVGLIKAAGYLYDAGVTLWMFGVFSVMFMLCFMVVASLVMAVVYRRKK